MARFDSSGLATNPSLKTRLHDAFWALLWVVVVCYLSWDVSAYLIKFWETGNPWRLITPVGLAAVLVYALRLADIGRRKWLIFPTALALAAPVALHVLDQRVQPNSRLLSDAYESALGRASHSAPKLER